MRQHINNDRLLYRNKSKSDHWINSDRFINSLTTEDNTSHTNLTEARHSAHLEPNPTRAFLNHDNHLNGIVANENNH